MVFQSWNILIIWVITFFKEIFFPTSSGNAILRNVINISESLKQKSRTAMSTNLRLFNIPFFVFSQSSSNTRSVAVHREWNFLFPPCSYSNHFIIWLAGFQGKQVSSDFCFGFEFQDFLFLVKFNEIIPELLKLITSPSPYFLLAYGRLCRYVGNSWS